MSMELELEPLQLPSDKERPIVIAGPCSAMDEACEGRDRYDDIN